MVLEGTLPSGREKAIETLIDMEPQGAYYRAARVVVSQASSLHKLTSPCLFLSALLFVFVFSHLLSFIYPLIVSFWFIG